MALTLSIMVIRFECGIEFALEVRELLFPRPPMTAVPSEQTVHSSELTHALQRFQKLFDPAAINARQAYSPATVYTPAVVVWLMVYQRLHGNATLETAVDELLRMTRELPANPLPVNRRIEDQTLTFTPQSLETGES